MTDKTTPSREELLRLCDQIISEERSYDTTRHCRHYQIARALRHHLTTSPAPPDHGESGANPLDGFPELAVQFEYLAHNMRNISLERWQAFSDALYSALRRISAAPEKPNVEMLNGIYPQTWFCHACQARWTGGSSEHVCKPEPAASVPVTRAALGRLHDAIRDAALKFREYQKLHQAKSPPDLRKANANAWMANSMEKALEEAASLLASHSPPVATRAAGVGEQVEEIAKRHVANSYTGTDDLLWSEESNKSLLQQAFEAGAQAHKDRATLLSLIRRQHGGP